MRWSYIVPRLIILGLLWSFFALAFDPLLRWGLQSGGSSALGAKVEIGRLRTRFFPPSIELDRFSAADPGQPMSNMLEFSSARLRLQGRPLLERKIVVDQASLSGIAFGTARKSSGALPRRPQSKAAKMMGEWVQSSKAMPLRAWTSAKSEAVERYQVKPEDLSSLRMSEELKKKWPSAFQAWQERIKAVDAEGKAARLQELFEEAQKSKDAPARIQKAAELQRQAQQFRQEIGSLKKELEAQASQARADLDAVARAKASDIENLRGKLQLPSFDAEALSAFLLGEQASARILKALRLLETARRYMPAKSSPPKPTRSRGLTVEFPREKSWPAFWLVRTGLSGSVDLGAPLDFSGEAADFSSNPPLVGRPATLKLRGGQGARRANLEAVLDHTGEVPADSLRFDYAGLPMAAMKVGDSASFALGIGAGTASISGSIGLKGDALEGSIAFRQDGVTLEPSFSGPSETGRLLGGAFAGIRSLEGRLLLGGTLDKPQIRISSNLGAALSQGLKASLGKEIQARTKELEAQVSRLVDGSLSQLKGELDGQTRQALAALGVGDQKLDELQRKIQDQLKLPLKIPSFKKLGL